MDKSKNQYIKRTQKDYSMSFKLAVVKEVESGEISTEAVMRKYGIQSHSTILNWRRKFGIFDLKNSSNSIFMKTPQQRIQELEQKLRLLESKNDFLEEQLMKAEDKAYILDKLIDIAEKEYMLPVRKNSFPDQSKKQTKKGKGQ
ncbi:MAG: transposase [Brumimicrobium sp.]|nr:transposase [Brumimicrobium sp.]MCO5268300.1 transposase [Brumimicrobium sp.]MCO5268851.1 transposase [Brumimicrobium sp.]MCO5269330.1 transposase [Brumimicrobium sp.]MCO5269384.1 transposase [Brumimicrobium sp.]